MGISDEQKVGFLGSCKRKLISVMERIKKLGRDDPRRIIHSLKVGLALTFVSLLYYWRPLYDGFGIAAIWAVLTVVVVFEFTVGATLSKGLNRGLGTLLAGALGVGAQHFASLFGQTGEPIVLGIFVFLLAAASTFSRFFPRIKARYDYGVLIFILTFSLVSVSGYRVEKILELAHQRLSTILIGGATCVFISLFICPVWAGETLHNTIASNIEKLANYLEGFGGEYFQYEDGEENIIVEDHHSKSHNKLSCLQAYKSVLTSQSSEESLANLASWEPRHGKFSFGHPWKQYLKIGSLTRQCAYQIESLNGYVIPADIQVAIQFRRRIEESCKAISSESGKALRILASSIKTMKSPSSSSKTHIENAKAAIDDLKHTLKSGYLESSDLLGIIPDATVCCILIDIVKSVEKISEATDELGRSARFKSVEATVSPEKTSQLLHRGIVNPVFEGECGDGDDHVVIRVNDNNNNNEVDEIGKCQGNLDVKPTSKGEIIVCK
ncbi:aluminum-activated malate transporter 8 [Cucumis melo var. makuwa]|uniref:Aluminum-activated malate transporter 8 n=2 Tax=Cucumis melo TaxID=3656 RepID=A0A1S3CIY6_CUCME|nr:aluminum-activated malate transporter 8 [Cucumis melo]KAA0025215.1 aluminum-activated malate transporter 8 [Cucumis melo var. makuwa]TYK07450.1 aluminum-activated malate transporter 8 [Cucumis melo var. makuwa]